MERERSSNEWTIQVPSDGRRAESPSIVRECE